SGCNPALLRTLMESRYVPVLSPLACDDDGKVLNINADTVASRLAGALQAEKLIIMSNTNGLLRDVADPASRYEYLTAQSVTKMLERGEITGGMAPKLTAVVEAIAEGVKRAYIVNGLKAHSLLKEVFTRKGQGTMILDAAGEEEYLARG
ncbi:MAG: hypothetical protein OEY28_13785, partial [Nitrospira sp.]|nr:hypothetical protein [Nitrospira sp.]